MYTETEKSYLDLRRVELRPFCIFQQILQINTAPKIVTETTTIAVTTMHTLPDSHHHAGDDTAYKAVHVGINESL